MFAAHQPLLPDYVRLNGKWHADKPAWICGEAVLTWRMFSARVNQVAHGLITLGVGPGDTIGIVMDNGLEMAEALWGAMAAGAVAVPMNTSVSDLALGGMLKDADVRAVFTTSAHTGRIASLTLPSLLPQGRIAVEDGYAAWRDAQPETAPKVHLDPDSPCSIIYSSGTTGQPKGIVHTHRRRLDWGHDLAMALRYHGASVNLCAIGLYSNIVWAGMLPTVIAGGTLVILPKFNADAALQAISRHRVTNMAMVPLQYRRLVDAPLTAGLNTASLQALMSAGSPLWDDLKIALVGRFGPTIIELYGLTEGLVTTLAPEEVLMRPGSVGKPLPGTDLRLLKDDGTDTGPGEVGEIIGCGRIVMAGYHNRPEATSEVMLTDDAGRMWLRTGDLGRFDKDGYLYVVGRKKDLILSGGQNIYPSDIEAVAVAHPDVADVAVVGIPDEVWGETPLALVVRRPGVITPPEVLMQWINSRVGKQQRVCRVEIRPDLPRNPNGKLLKTELRAPYWPA